MDRVERVDRSDDVGDGVNREEALALVREKTEKDTTVRHLISVEGIMRRLGSHFEEDPDLWALAGLFHDLDQDQTHDDLERHAYLAAQWLRDAGADERVVNAALAHAHDEYRTDLMSRAVVHADALSGFLVACALVRPEKAGGMKVSSVRKKLKEKAFAPGVARDDIRNVEDGIGLPVDEFIALGIEGLQSVAAEIGL
jgi:putative nucleotidyltransferase with HDIG domain